MNGRIIYAFQKASLSNISLGWRILGGVLEKYENKIKLSNLLFPRELQCTH